MLSLWCLQRSSCWLMLGECAGAFEKDPSRARLPAITINLYDASLNEACRFQLYNEAEKSSPINDARVWRFDDMNSLTRNATTGLFTRSFPFQNFQSCTSSQASITVVGFSSDAANVSFCLEDLRLLPSEVPSPGEGWLLTHALVACGAQYNTQLAGTTALKV